jgi:carbamoylphosphate synthase small subunit
MMQMGNLCDTKRAGTFSVQYHPELLLGPMNSHYLFEKFAGMMGK